MEASLPVRAVGWAVVVAVLVGCSQGGYIITTPRQWVSGGASQLCVDVDDPAAPEGLLTLSANQTYYYGDDPEEQIIIRDVTVPIPAGANYFCEDIQMPQKSYYRATLWIRGRVAGEFLNRTLNLDMTDHTRETYIQTDKFLYQPNQKVQIRVLTMHLSNLTVSQMQYPQVWVTTPSKVRIAQWTDVDNSGGLIHLEMMLADEPEPGRYTVHVKDHEGKTQRNHFEVREYTVPRFEVTVAAGKKLVITDKVFPVKVCARYTYGQPVKGSLTLEVGNNRYDECYAAKNYTYTINGCMNIRVKPATLRVIDCSVGQVRLRAWVTEGGTGIIQKSAATFPIARNTVTFKKIYQDTFKRHGLPYVVKVRAEGPDGAPAAEVPVEMCKGDMCFNLTTSDDGMIITTAGKNEFKTMQMKALNTRVMTYESTFSTDVKRYYSPSNSSLLIYTPDEKLKCVEGEQGFDYQLPVFFVSNLPRASFTVQIISKHTVQYYKKTEEYTLTPGELPIRPDEQVEPLEDPPQGTIRGVVYIPITLSNSLSPSARVVVWMVLPDGEVVSDAKDLEIEKCLPNTAELAWSEAHAEPGQEVEMQLTSAPNSLCSLGVVDKGTLLLDTRPKSLTIENIFRSLEYSRLRPWLRPRLNDRKYCRNQLGHDDFNHYFTKYYDTLGMLTGSGLHVLSNLVLETRPCEKRPRSFSPPWYSDYNAMRTQVVALASESPSTISGGEESSRVRSHFPETWLWDLHVLPTSGVFSDHVTMPDTITEWVGQAVCVHSEKGLGLSQFSNITTFTPFFVDLTLPPSIIRGETLAIPVSIFNYLESSLPVLIQVHRSSEYEIIKEPSSQQPEGVLEACVHGNTKVVLEVKIKPTVLGEVNITVGASVDQQSNNECGAPAPKVARSDTLVKPITVKAEGFLRERTWNKYICAKDLADESDSLDRWPIEALGDIVEGSDRAWVTVVGSLLSVSLENLGHLIRMPYGCGEQNMINFAPNVFILQYLTTTRQATPEATTKLLRYMNTGYQRQLLYLRGDGSYSAFGNADPFGSTWLTAFVVKSLAQAQPFISIDSDNLKDSMDWLKKSQTFDGCFDTIGQVFNKALKGGIANRGREALTAYVLISLKEAGEESNSSAVVNATSCLLSLPAPSQHPYSLALRAYALALVGESEARTALASLMAQAVVTSSSMYWELPKGYSRSASLLVETAGYAILSMVTLDAQAFETDIRKVVKWITEQRNGQGGFHTTQDTVVALQALSKYESTQHQGDMDFVATIKGNGINHSFAFDEDNKLVTQRAPINSLPTSLTLTMVGQGCAVFQSVLRYNVLQPDPSDTFSLSIHTHTAADRTCTTKWINTCATYLLSDGNSNMAVIAVDLVSGYVPEKDDLKQIVKNSPGVVKRYEVDGNQVQFYIEEFSEGQEVCLRFKVIRLVDVEGAKPGSVSVYDYYQPELTISKTYMLPPNDDCQYTT